VPKSAVFAVVEEHVRNGSGLLWCCFALSSWCVAWLLHTCLVAHLQKQLLLKLLKCGWCIYLMQALDEKVIIFKKKRRKNYRRTTGHRQVSIRGYVHHFIKHFS
jgi:hypothetical protein